VYPNAGSLFPVAIHGVVGYLEITEMRFADAASLDPVADPFTDPDTYAALYFNRQADDSLRPPSANHSEYRSGRGSSSPRQTFHQGDGRIAWRTRTGIPIDGPIASAPRRTVTAYEPVFNIVGAIAERGPGAYADLATLAHARALVPARSDIADLIDLLQARLGHRYDTEIALGTASGAAPAMSDDISIGRPTSDDPR
jgi:hypothetical protein